MSNSDIYIDEICVYGRKTGTDPWPHDDTETTHSAMWWVSNSDTLMPGITDVWQPNATSTSGEGAYTISTPVYGWKWIVQLVNSNESGLSVTTDKLRLRIQQNYRTKGVQGSDNNVSGVADGLYNYDIDLDDITIAAGASHYVGWNDAIGSGTTFTPSPITLKEKYLCDQAIKHVEISDVTYEYYMRHEEASIYSDWLLETYSSSYNDNNAEINIDKWEGGHKLGIEYSYGIHNVSGVTYTYNWYVSTVLSYMSNNTTNQWTSIRRKHTNPSTYPTSTYSSSDWQNSSTVYGTNLYHLNSAAAGDPHITTLNGEHYKFDYFGAFRLFENYGENNNRLVINGLSEEGPGRWKKRQYIRKLFIQNNDKYMLIDMGFRGSPVKILENNGIEYNEKQLNFNKEARRHSFDSTYSTLDSDEPVTDILPLLIRNQIDLTINMTNNENMNEEIHITLQNVNEYNLQPCRLTVSNINKDLIQEAKGCLVDRKYAPVSKLDNIQSLERLEEPSLEDLKNIPELEIDPKLKSIEWQ